MSQKPIANSKKLIANSRICIYKIGELGHNPALTNYITSSGIQLEIAKPYCREVYFTVNGQKYFGIGNKNNSGWSIRNKYWKGCTAQGYSFCNNQTDKILVFEGIFDMLSFLELNSRWKRSTDILILNFLVNIVKTMPMLQRYQSIELYLDHDTSGTKATETIIQLFPNARDASKFYSSFKDLNEYHLAKFKQ